jgi:hypothetical protein
MTKLLKDGAQAENGPEVEELTEESVFLKQFTVAEQNQLMSWLAELVITGEVEVDPSRPLSAHFRTMLRYLSHEVDYLAPRVIH